MNKTDISWCDYTWNPVTGCKRRCVYCYARKIHNRFNKTTFSDIVFHPERLNDPSKIKKPSTIFVGSMSDVSFWKPVDTELIIDVCRKYTQHTFMFLSKSSEQYFDHTWPINTMQGLTVEIPTWSITWNHVKNMAKQCRPFLSVEPISGGFHYKCPKEIELVIVGAETGNRKDRRIPQKSWIQSIIDNVPSEKIHWKPNVLPYINEYGISINNNPVV